MRLRISARKSDLARLQAYQVGDALKNQQPGLEIEYFFKSSLGDINLTDPLWKIPTKGVFTEDFQGELLEGQTDMVVHSWKDLPTEANSKTFIAASLPRADQRDLLLIKKSSFVRLHSSKKMNLFSSSPRRIYNLESFCKTHLPFALQQVDFNSVRGNIPTRLQKTLQATETDGIIVAKAALDRLLSAQQEEFQATRLQLRQDLSKFEFCVLPLSINPNAAAQGSLAVEILRTRTDLEKILNQINDKNSYQTSQKERDILASYGGGCQQKIGISCLQRSYGELSFLKGETQSGQILNEKKLALAQEKKWICLETELWNGQHHAFFDRQALAIDPENLHRFSGLWISRQDAWPENLQWSGPLWCAGLKTWQALAKKGLWVHGSSESLGENENPNLDILCDEKIHWALLTHDQSADLRTDSKNSLVATYKLIEKTPSKNLLEDLSKHTFFFWNSGSQFQYALKHCPEIKNKHHACGPGHSFDIIRGLLLQHQSYEANKLQVVLEPKDLFV